ncbi:PSD1 and planctomycete cytochrome C domain-containing protein [Anatilimnocola floriformis]|uniref:PSD1 and planctomycete cytochrome C domain-containing protein n=1 Tax=Anatilimnocola floriformis TaxID=2948575 RepID=UPI0020C5939C|nr:PSD1 and planctomycete cytochrome C domain-containing protein [Anatilimnocola floriformis]
MSRWTRILVAMVVVGNSISASADAPNFSRDILPILSDNCFHCHGPDPKAREADLQLDTEAGALRTEDAVIIPGKSADSKLYQRLISSDHDEVMPPPKSNRKLTAAQIELVKRWIDAGAKWGKHWAYETPQRPALPEVKNKAWPKNPIDSFLLARLEREQLQPSPIAPKETLIRRVTLDLTGLPPSLAEVDAFLKDDSPQAYEKVVDRLLTSRQYGERMVWDWLDAARYADTNGYQGDPTRAMWYWRDQVTEALNRNQPFDQFTIEQLAGDLLPNATQQQLIASGFHRNHMINGEGGRIAEESRVDYVQDRVETTGAVWMGLTFNCCRCHDHKFDPLKQREYYQLSAYFNSIEESGGNDAGGLANPILSFASPEQQTELDKLRAAEKESKTARDEFEKKLPELQKEWEQNLTSGDGPAEPKWQAFAIKELNATDGVTLKKLDDGSILAEGTNADKSSYEIEFRPTEDLTVTALKLEALPHESLINNGPGRADNGNFVLSEVTLAQAKKPLLFDSATADFAQDGWPARGVIDANPTTGWAVMPAFGKIHTLTLPLKLPTKFAKDQPITIKLSFQFGRQHTLGHFRILATDSPIQLLKTTPEAVLAAMKVSRDQRNAEQKKLLSDHFRASHSPWLIVQTQSDEARNARDKFEKGLPRTMVMRERAQPRETFILTRGAYDKPEAKVSHGTPAILPPLPADAPANRLALARWLVSPEHPLTSRVVVNRYWQSFFGTGLVKTTEDFGVQSERPPHPELLDWLACEFREPTVSQPTVAHTNEPNRWNVKHIHRLIVTSAAYQQSSKSTPALNERDPANRLLARAPRQRWPSWMIRDQALAVSGLLVDKAGGPPVKGYQPTGVWEEASFGGIRYTPDTGEALYRRSLYQFWRRIVGPTVFFDVANRQTCSVKSNRTNTPLHSLTTLNDVTYVEAARAWAEKLMKSEESPEKRLQLAYRQLLSREPSAQELKIVLAALAQLQSKYADEEAAKKLLAIGASKRDEKLNLADHAALTAICNLLLNLDEALTKE